MENANPALGKTVLTAQEVGEKLRISLSTVHHLTRLGKIKAIKVGKQWRYAEDDVESYLTGGFDFRKAVDERRRADRRFYPRINCFIQGHARIALAPVKYWEGDGSVMNLSEGGMLFELAVPPADHDTISCDDPISIALFFPAQFRRELALEGRVIHTECQDKARFGIKFRNLSSEVQTAIQEYIG